ncbi:MAG: tRNA preQ1(34) S-adenosylmethionine ribosyltransferase-isomerase QueA [Armatimonadetes bacterium]|nr:tRNA preQ1(34) S-adenosylmethionine ribosyltransferase-isomerase QueA [Armatimonadota bacterium]
MRVDIFEYDLPEELIAQEPLPERSASRMMVLRRAEAKWEHRWFRELPTFLRPGDLLVLNDTRVIPARLIGRRPSGGRVEILLLRPLSDTRWEALGRPGRGLQPGQRLVFGDTLSGVIVASRPEGVKEIEFQCEGSVLKAIEEIGLPPLPPYIKRPVRPEDSERYQTIYARKPGAVAAPTAGLHFDAETLRKVQDVGAEVAYVTLHVGLGTFRPVNVENVEEHQMHPEWYAVPDETAQAVATARKRGGRIIAVGTTVVRTLETAAREDGTIAAGEGETSLFIYPGYRFKVVDAMLTNFHLPRSTLLMMVCAFAGRDLVLSAYREAVRERYRFYSYGDCMLIL